MDDLNTDFELDNPRSYFEDLNEENKKNLIKNKEYFQIELKKLIQHFSKKIPNYDLARNILGECFVSPEDITQYFKNVHYTEEQLLQFKYMLPSKEILEWCRDNKCMLVSGPSSSMSLLDIRTVQNKYFLMEKDGWYSYAKNTFSQHDKVKAQWYIIFTETDEHQGKDQDIFKDLVNGLVSKNWDEKQILIPNVSNSAEFAWHIMVCKVIKNQALFKELYVKTSSVDYLGNHVYVGYFVYYCHFTRMDDRFINVHSNDGMDSISDLGVGNLAPRGNFRFRKR